MYRDMVCSLLALGRYYFVGITVVIAALALQYLIKERRGRHHV